MEVDSNTLTDYDGLLGKMTSYRNIKCLINAHILHTKTAVRKIHGVLSNDYNRMKSLLNLLKLGLQISENIL